MSNVGDGLSKMIKKSKGGALRIKGGFDKKTKRNPLKKKKKSKKKKGEAKSTEPLTESRAQELMWKSLGEDNLKKLMAASHVPSAKEFMYIGDRYIKKGSASDLLNQRTKTKSDHWCK
mmetsp:Transcript_29065/g.70897  ORF Transcript_29065/g.70897 Transcript_29065/m.70897 type:complete len:118 (+) Transcript_29065:115-468(+)|eukprot:CAMPEP_0114513230 /NCGR_PEP_ID=MMETSP0109-20121206/15442_1 /TAXON_ID=29199 /ORGANISM="Chlorarachnion reptans, Strain CCCM449" /LENGTH=117 /DNA_ID=CAMNT_0001693055 /DNA_START=95 /DNA_END=448 /DNA_ORIENTATION=+